jgi:hypothetical protein
MPRYESLLVQRIHSIGCELTYEDITIIRRACKHHLTCSKFAAPDPIVCLAHFDQKTTIPSPKTNFVVVSRNRIELAILEKIDS